MISSLASVLDGSYSRDIQLALGDSGASVKITSGTAGSVQISGTPNGDGLKIKAAEAATSSKASAFAGKDAVTFSPAARAALFRQEIALQLLGNKRSSSTTEATESDKSATNDVASASAATAQSVTTPTTVSADDITTLAKQDPTQVVQDAANAGISAVAQISTTEGFYSAVASDPSIVQQLGSGMGDDLNASFVAAVKAGTVTTQSGQEAGWDVGGGIQFTGLSMGTVEGINTRSKNFDTSETNVMLWDAGFGQVIFSWPK